MLLFLTFFFFGRAIHFTIYLFLLFFHINYLVKYREMLLLNLNPCSYPIYIKGYTWNFLITFTGRIELTVP